MLLKQGVHDQGVMNIDEPPAYPNHAVKSSGGPHFSGIDGSLTVPNSHRRWWLQ